jgi:hypothetical protein
MTVAVDSSAYLFPSFREFAGSVVAKYAKPLFLLDVDATMIRPQDDLPHADACAIARGGRVSILTTIYDIAAANRVLEVAPYVLVEPEMPEVIEELRKKGIPVEGLTARGYLVETLTRDQLASVGITMDVHFSNGQLKGDYVDAILQKHPDCDVVAFADDSLKQLLSVAKRVDELGKSFEGYHSQVNDRSFDLRDLDSSRMRAQLRHVKRYDIWVPDREWIAGSRPGLKKATL